MQGIGFSNGIMTLQIFSEGKHHEKKTLSKILAAITVLALVFCLAGCGNSKKDEAIDAFNSTSASFNEVATLINENSSAIDGDIIETFQEMSALLSQYKDILEGNSKYRTKSMMK